jgi:hypothetical protein
LLSLFPQVRPKGRGRVRFRVELGDWAGVRELPRIRSQFEGIVRILIGVMALWHSFSGLGALSTRASKLIRVCHG